MFLGEGAMGAVYKARQISLEKTIAIKVMHLDLVADRTFAARFHREAKAASRLDHPNSIGILDFGEEPDGLLYIAMEFLDGHDLLHVIDHESPLSSRRIVDILAQVLSALSMAHEMGIIHRDLKPENIMILQRKIESLGEGELVKVCDFGIAKVADSGDPALGALPSAAKKRGRLTTAGLVVGTPEYMSPEQGRGDVLDARSDLYAVGVILYHLLTGRIPFDAPTPLGIVVKHQHEDPILPSLVRPGTDVRLEDVCLRAMQKRPTERYASAREMRSALRAAIDGPSSTPSLANGLGVGSELPHEGSRTGRARVETSAPLTASTDSLELRPWVSRFGGRVLAIALGALALGVGARYATRMPEALRPPALSPVAESLPSAPAPPVLAPSSAAPPALSPALASTASTATFLFHESTVPSGSRPTRTPLSAPVHPVPPPPQIPPVVRSKEVAASASPPPEPSAVVQPLPAPPLPSAATETARPVTEPVAAPQPVPPPFDPARAHVELGPAQIATGGAPASSVNRVLSSAHEKMSRCYRWSASERSPEGTWNLRILTDDAGNISEVRIDGPLPREVKECIASALRGGKVDADTGAVTADVQLTFKLR
jgi:serine/threonine-protein kinase